MDIHCMPIFIIDQSLPADRHTDQLICTLIGGSRQTEPDSAQRCPVTGRGDRQKLKYEQSHLNFNSI